MRKALFLTPPQVSLLVNRITVKMPIFGAIFFYANYATMLIFLIGLFYSIAKDKVGRGGGIKALIHTKVWNRVSGLDSAIFIFIRVSF